MPSTKLATLIDSWYPRAQRLAITLFILIALLIVVLSKPADGDDLTGLTQEDPKELGPAQAPAQSTDMGFQPLPTWARGAVMPPLPDALKPMGKKVVVMTTPPTPASGASSRETPSAPVVTAAVLKPAPASAPAPSPALVAVSPFLQWIQANPQAAAAQARQQANAYHASSTSNAGSSATVTSPTGNTPAGSATDPYWLPPLIDTAPFGAQSGGSAAIYETPQR